MWMTSLSASVEFVIYSHSQPTMLKIKLAATLKTQSPFLKWDGAYIMSSTFETMLKCHTHSQIILRLYTQKRSFKIQGITIVFTS